jgi:hypothetical protein
MNRCPNRLNALSIVRTTSGPTYPAAVAARRETALQHRIEIECTHYAFTGARYRVTYMGQTLIETTGHPEFDTCRALLASGLKGMLAIYSPGSSVPRMRVDIEVGAKLTTIDNATKGPRLGRYRPRPNSGEPDETE